MSPDSVMLTLYGLTLGDPFRDNRAIKGHGLEGDLLLEDLLRQISPIALWEKLRNFFPQLFDVSLHTGMRQVKPCLRDTRAAER